MSAGQRVRTAAQAKADNDRRRRQRSSRWAAAHKGHRVTHNAIGQSRCLTCTRQVPRRTDIARPDDGIVDQVVIARLIAGHDIPFTVRERQVAVHRMDAAGVPRNEIARRLALSGTALRAILAEPEPVETLADESDQVDELDEELGLRVAA